MSGVLFENKDSSSDPISDINSKLLNVFVPSKFDNSNIHELNIDNIDLMKKVFEPFILDGCKNYVDRNNYRVNWLKLLDENIYSKDDSFVDISFEKNRTDSPFKSIRDNLIAGEQHLESLVKIKEAFKYFKIFQKKEAEPLSEEAAAEAEAEAQAQARAAVKIEKFLIGLCDHGYINKFNHLIQDEGYDFIERIAESRAKIDSDLFKTQNKKPDLTIKQKSVQVSLSVVSSFVGAVMVFEGWMQFMSKAGVAGAGLAISNPLQVIPIVFSGFITVVSYLVNYNLYKAKIGDCLYKKEDSSNDNEGNDSKSFSILQKLTKGLMVASICVYTFAFFLASFQNEFLFGDFCKNFMGSSALNGKSFLQLLTSTPVGIALSSVFLAFAVLSAACQFYFAVSSIIKHSPAESFNKIKSYFNKIFIGIKNNKVNKYKISGEDLHAKLNFEIYKLKKEKICNNKKEEVEKFRKVFSHLKINEKAKLLVILQKMQKLNPGDNLGAVDLSLSSISKELSELGICLKDGPDGENSELYCKKSEFQVALELSFKVISVALFILGSLSLMYYLGPLVLAMFPALLALKVVLGVSCASIFLARMPVSLESGFWGSRRLAHFFCNLDEFKFKWKYNTGRFKCLGNYGLLIEKTSLNVINAIANMAFAFFSASSGGMTYVFGASLFYLSLVITMKPSFEKKNIQILGGVIQLAEAKKNQQDGNNDIKGGFWNRIKDSFDQAKNRILGRNNNSDDSDDSDDSDADNVKNLDDINRENIERDSMAQEDDGTRLVA